MDSNEQIRLAELAEKLRQLHNAEEMLVLPNIWDPLGAIFMEELGYEAVATASAAVAYANGFEDGENIPFDDFLSLHRRITACINVPVTADIETGFSADNGNLANNIGLLIDAGVVGINIEDTDKATGKIRDVYTQCERLRIVRETAESTGVPLVINARTDVLPHNDVFVEQRRLDEILSRGNAYKDAGADCFFPIMLADRDEISAVVSQVGLPVNIIHLPGAPDLATLAAIGVKRVSLGPSVLKAAFRTVRDLAIEIRDNPRFAGVNETEITSPYLKHLVSRNH